MGRKRGEDVGWGGKQQTNSFSFAVERDGCSEALHVFSQAGRPRESQGLSLLFTIGFYSFCYLLALGFAALPEKWPGNINALLFEVKPGFPFAVLATVWFKRSGILVWLVVWGWGAGKEGVSCLCHRAFRCPPWLLCILSQPWLQTFCRDLLQGTKICSDLFRPVAFSEAVPRWLLPALIQGCENSSFVGAYLFFHPGSQNLQLPLSLTNGLGAQRVHSALDL